MRPCVAALAALSVTAAVGGCDSADGRRTGTATSEKTTGDTTASSDSGAISATSVASAGPTIPPAPASPVTAAVAVASSTDPPPTTDAAARTRLALQAARDRWRVAAVSTYEYGYTVRCDCDAPIVTVRVLGNRPIVPIMAAAYDGHGVVEWFAVIEAAIESELLIEAAYDDRMGYPVSVTIAEEAGTVDELVPYGIDAARVRTVNDPIERWFTQSWGCGRRLVAATGDQTAAVVLEFDDTVPSGYTPGRRDVATLESAAVWFGSDLFSGWCDETLDPDEPIAQLLETWPVTDGTIDLAATGSPFAAIGRASGLVATDADGRAVMLGDAELVNRQWGALPV